MRAIIFAFPALGLLSCLCIALRPQMMQRHVERVQRAWGMANLPEKIGLVCMVVPIPGPFDEFIGFVFIGIGRIVRIARRRKETLMSH